MKKTGFVLFLLLAAVLSLSACGNSAKQEDSAPAATSAADTAAETTAPLSPEELRASLSDGLPDKNFDGRKFTVISETYLQESDRRDVQRRDLRAEQPHRRALQCEGRRHIP